MSTLDDWIANGDGAAQGAPKAAPSALDTWVEGGDVGGAAKVPMPAEGGVGHKLGLGLRNVIDGVAGLPALALDAATAPGRAIQRGFGMREGTAPSAMLHGAEDAVGLPQPQSLSEQRASRLIEGVAGVLPTMGAGAALQAARPMVGSMAERAAGLLTANPGIQAAAGAGAGAGGQAAEEGGAGPLGQTVAGLGGAVLGAAVPSAAGAMMRGGMAVAAPFSQAGREAIVRDTMLRQSADPAGLQARLMASKLDPTVRLPDSPVTTAQAARDPGLSGFEGGLRSDTGAGAPGSLTPAARFANIDTARNAARAEALPAPMPEAASGQGGQLRGQLREAEGQRTAGTSSAYEAIDPEGGSMIPLRHVQTTFNDAAAKYYGDMSGGLPGDLRGVSEDLLAVNEAPWRSVQNLRGRLVALQDKYHGDARAQAMLNQVKGSIDDVAERAANPKAPASMAVDMADLEAQHAAEGAGQRPDVVEAMRQNRLPLAEQSAAAAGNGPVPAHQGLASFLISKGGLRNDGGELMTVLGDTRARPALFSKGGLPLDRARELAHEAGYLSGNKSINGAGGSDVSDLIDALRSDLNTSPRSGRTATGERSLVDQVAQNLDEEHGVSLNDPPATVLRAVRDPIAGETPGGVAPDGYGSLENAFTPEQAAKWREATALRQQQGQDFGLDQTGARAVPNILQRGQGGGPNVPDKSVMSHALSDPNAVRQVVRAGGEETLPGLRQAFMDRAFEATSPKGAALASDGNPTMSAPSFLKYWRSNQDVAKVIFPPGQLDRMTQLASDFNETHSATTMRKLNGSDTARNLSVANVIAMASKGMIDPSNTAVQALMSPVALLTKMSGSEAAVKHLLVEAMADPVLAQKLLAKATPDAIDMATGYIRQSMGQRVGEAVGDAAGRTALRGGQAGAVGAEQQQQPAQPPMRMVPPVMMPPPANSDARRRAEMAQRLMQGQG